MALNLSALNSANKKSGTFNVVQVNKLTKNFPYKILEINRVPTTYNHDTARLLIENPEGNGKIDAEGDLRVYIDKSFLEAFPDEFMNKYNSERKAFLRLRYKGQCVSCPKKTLYEIIPADDLEFDMFIDETFGENFFF